MRLRARLAGTVLGVSVLAASLELALRAQQRLGPIIDLEMTALLEPGPDEDPHLNHRPYSKRIRLAPKSVYGAAAGLTYEETRDALGLKLSAFRPGMDADGYRILMLGDSFVEGYDDRHTLAQALYEALSKQRLWSEPPVVLNGGVLSYSPSIYMAQAMRLVPKVRPDLVVVVVDQTDLGDDFYRYRGLTTRSANGYVTAVRPSAIAGIWRRGLAEAAQHRSYIARLAHKRYFSTIVFPRLRAEQLRSLGFEHDDQLHPLRQPTIQARRRFAHEVSLFKTNIAALARGLARCMGRDRVLFVVHPHLGHLTDPPSLNRLVAETVAAGARSAGVEMADMEPTFKAAFASRPQDLYWPGDMHLNFEGLDAYGLLLSQELASRLKSGRLAIDRRPSTAGVVACHQ